MNIRARRRPVPTIPIVSMIDILVILLIFFIATTTFRQQKTHVKITLPESKTMGGAAGQAEVRMAISVSKEQKIYLDGKEVPADNLATALTSLREAKPGARLELEADTDAAFGLMIKVWDAVRMAGFAINDVPARIQRAPAPGR